MGSRTGGGSAHALSLALPPEPPGDEVTVSSQVLVKSLAAVDVPAAVTVTLIVPQPKLCWNFEGGGGATSERFELEGMGGRGAGGTGAADGGCGDVVRVSLLTVAGTVVVVLIGPERG